MRFGARVLETADHVHDGGSEKPEPSGNRCHRHANLGHTLRTFQKYGPVASITPVSVFRYALRIWNKPRGMLGT